MFPAGNNICIIAAATGRRAAVHRTGKRRFGVLGKPAQPARRADGAHIRNDAEVTERRNAVKRREVAVKPAGRFVERNPSRLTRRGAIRWAVAVRGWPQSSDA
jgi:hypothetical protein